MDLLLSAYPKLADKHRDHDGVPPRRTWFFPPHYHRNGSLPALVKLCQQGYGEVELHLHHGKHAPDTADNLRRTIEQTVEEYAAFGTFGSENGRKRYGFVHGDWSLDNSRNGEYCGVNSELTVLRETGCYADFTFPAMAVPSANPDMVNRIFYATDDPERPRSYARGREVAMRRPASGDLMMIQGPVHPYTDTGDVRNYRMFGDGVGCEWQIDDRRIDMWIKTGIHVIGRRNWVFVKTHTHGAEDAKIALGESLDRGFAYMESRYNDESRYVLHYVTAREMYNIIKAAEAGEAGGDPNQYRNYRVSAPQYDFQAGLPEASEELKALVRRTYRD